MALPLEGKVAVVTGSTRGIGKVIAKYLAQDGADIVVCGRSEESTWELPGTISETAQEIESLGRRALAVKMDLASDEDMKAMVTKAMETFGKIDILVNNAMFVGPRVKFLGSNTDLLDISYRVNVRAPYFLALLIGPTMAANGGGMIFNISSGAARHPEPPFKPQPTFEPQMSPSYGISKAALNRFGTAYAGELLASGISLMTVVPGLTVTERIERNPLRPGVDLSRADSPDVTAKAVAFLARDPLAYAGSILTAKEVVEKNGL